MPVVPQRSLCLGSGTGSKYARLHSVIACLFDWCLRTLQHIERYIMSYTVCQKKIQQNTWKERLTGTWESTVAWRVSLASSILFFFTAGPPPHIRRSFTRVPMYSSACHTQQPCLCTNSTARHASFHTELSLTALPDMPRFTPSSHWQHCQTCLVSHRALTDNLCPFSVNNLSHCKTFPKHLQFYLFMSCSILTFPWWQQQMFPHKTANIKTNKQANKYHIEVTDTDVQKQHIYSYFNYHWHHQHCARLRRLPISIVLD